MAIELRIKQSLEEAARGRAAYLERRLRQSGQSGRPVERLVEDLRAIPSEDRRKKEELAAFFASAAGKRYSRSERHEAYNQLLGRQRNREHMG